MDLRYPVGRSQRESPLEPTRRAELIDEIGVLPERVREALRDIRPEEWGYRYREGGWTVRQVVHHLADSHVNAFVRLRLALTEDRPTIKPYDEALWAELPDVLELDPEVSIRLLEALHQRWVALLRSLPEPAFAREFVHPDFERPLSLDDLIVTYAWHGRHHTAHIAIARSRSRVGVA